MNTMTTSVVRIAPDLNGPRRLANGGMAAGAFAALVPGPATVRLRTGVPLDKDLDVYPTVEGFEIDDHGRPIATVVATDPFVQQPPVRPDRAQAEAARRAHPWLDKRHALSDCVVCGPRRADGLHVTPGPLAADPSVLAAPFDPPARFTEDGRVTPQTVWGALDCVSYPARLVDRLALLGELSVHRTREIDADEHLVAVGWTISSGTRSHQTASALLAEDGSVIASSRAVWVEVRHQRLARFVGRWL
jgi:hypothetical protein